MSEFSLTNANETSSLNLSGGSSGALRRLYNVDETVRFPIQNMKKYWLLLVLPFVLLLWWGLDRGEAAPQVHFAVVDKATIESTVSTNGKVEPAQWAAARAETAGVVRAIAVRRGETVRAGQALVSLDSASAQSDLATALAREQEARAEIATLGQGGKASAVAGAEASIKSARIAVDAAERNYDSMRRLQMQQAATKLQADEARDTLDRAKQQLTAAEDQKKTLVTAADKTVAQAKLRDALAAVELARHRLSLGSVVSPIAGAVYQFDLKIGAYLQPGDLVALIGKVDKVKVTVYVDEPDLGRVAEGMPVRITWDARPGQIWWGRVDRMPTEVVALGSRTVGEVATTVGNPNRDLLPGVTVNATVVSKVAKDVVSVPKAALRSMNGTNGVYKLDDRNIRWTPVKTGVSDVNNVEILSGLRLGDYVADRAVEPADAEIKPDMRVRPILH